MWSHYLLIDPPQGLPDSVPKLRKEGGPLRTLLMLRLCSLVEQISLSPGMTGQPRSILGLP
jgi:hypothetical protein